MKKLYQTFVAMLLAGSSYAQTTSVQFTTSGNFVVPASVTEITIELVGAGGTGGGNGGGGGGGGGYALGTYAVAPGSTLNVSVGVAGGGTVAGTTSVDALIYATGGDNGTSVSNPNIGGGGAGGQGFGGTIANFTGGNGGGGYWTYFGGGGAGAAGPAGNGSDGGNTIAWTGICLTPGGSGGAGGGAPGGDGGKGAGFTDASCNISDPSATGSNYGGGGGGGNGNGGAPSEGGPGYCVISYCTLDLSVTVAGNTLTANAVSPTSYQWIDCSTNTAIPGETNASFTTTVNGDYAVIITDGDCMDTSDCSTISCSIDVSTSLVNFTITANATGLTYQWLDCATNTPIAGETNGSFTATGDGDYAVIVNDGSCSDTSACVTINGVGVGDPRELHLQVYPNPFSNKISIENETGTEFFELTNMQGQLVWSGKNIEATDFSVLPQGTYVLKIRREENTQLISLIKK